MVKKLSILFLFCLFCVQILGQSLPSPKYGISFSDIGLPCKYHKKMFISFLKRECENKEDTLFLRLDKNGKDREIINGKYKVLSIDKKKDNFYVHKNKLKKKILYLIDVERVDTNSNLPQYVRIISFKESPKGGNKLIIGKSYQFTLFYLMGTDYSKPMYVDGQEVYVVRSCPRGRQNCFYKGIFIRFFDTQWYYYVESPNLNGLYYSDIKVLKNPN